ncbi:MAG: hypothetical protein WBA93_18735 [Microcoleaceae cyanobacterium]
MLERFRACYPTGCLISELITIHNGKYIVRVLVRVDGEILATGLAAADTVELAEDQARKRSLSTLPLDSSISPPQTISSSEAKTSVQLAPSTPSSDLLPQNSHSVNKYAQPKIEELPTSVSNIDSNQVPNSPTVSSGLEELEISTPLVQEELPPIPIESSINDENVLDSTPNVSRFDDHWLNTNYGTKDKEEKVDETTESLIDSTNDIQGEITSSEPIDDEIDVAQSMDNNNDIEIESDWMTASNPPQDLSDDHAKIDIFIDTLNWTKEEERDFLEQNYNQKTRSFLTPEELLDFQQYLEIMAKVTEELKIQRWKTKQKKDYLEYTHNKESLEQLNIDELQSFLQYLEVFAKTTNEIKRLGWNANQGKSYLKKNYGEEGRTRLSSEKLQDFLQKLEALDTPE